VNFPTVNRKKQCNLCKKLYGIYVTRPQSLQTSIAIFNFLNAFTLKKLTNFQNSLQILTATGSKLFGTKLRFRCASMFSALLTFENPTWSNWSIARLTSSPLLFCSWPFKILPVVTDAMPIPSPEIATESTIFQVQYPWDAFTLKLSGYKKTFVFHF